MGAGATAGTIEIPRVRALVRALRPAEWTKNLFVFSTLVFSGRFQELEPCLQTLVVFVAFCCVSSAGYLVNDLRDLDLDRQHPTKRNRPIASGALSETTARAAAATLAIAAIALGTVVAPAVGGMVILYATATVAYTVWLKHLVIIDVMSIAGLFLVRVLAGTVAIDVPASSWLLVCTGMLALFLGFTKRRQEAASEAASDSPTRPVLEHYSLPFLDQMVAMVTSGTVISYVIYAVDSPLVGERMLATAPMVVYGVFRYLYLIYDRAETRSAAALVTSDPGIIAAGACWAGTALLLIAL